MFKESLKQTGISVLKTISHDEMGWDVSKVDYNVRIQTFETYHWKEEYKYKNDRIG